MKQKYRSRIFHVIANVNLMVENVKCQCKCKKDNKTLCMQKDYAWNPGACA